jgi:glycosyltransferase involved in cell wall biosynthesis
MRALRILQTPARFYPAIGGVEQYVLQLSKALVRDNHDVTVVCADEPHSTDFDEVDGIRIIRLPYSTKIANTNITPELLKCLLRLEFDVIHTHIPTPWSADISALASLAKKKPLVITYHNDIMKEDRIERLLAKTYNSTLLQLALNRAHRIVITQPRYVEFSRYLQRYRKKVVTIPLGVCPPHSLGAIRRPPNQLFFLSVLDHHHWYKGLDVLLRALPDVRRRHPDTRLLVGGAGDLVPHYEAMARRLSVDQCVRFLGFVPDDKLAELYASSTVFVLPSLNTLEGFGIVALEALSYGTPVITTELVGSAEIIQQHRAGLIVMPGDVPSLTTALLRILSDPLEAQAMGARGAAIVSETFTWEKASRQMLRVYLEAARSGVE